MNIWKRICIAMLLFNPAAAFAGMPVTLYKSPACGCCEKYVQYLEQNGFTVNAIDEDNMDAVKKRHGTARAASCHTALISGYAIEGHVPVRAIRKLLREKPAIAGIGAPGMPQHSPGMGEEQPGTLTIYAISRNDAKPTVFSVE